MILPAGYTYSAVYAGIRKVEKDDLALICSARPASASAVFTTNRVQAAPVVLSRERLKKSGGVARALLINAGNANCATRTGMAVAEVTTKALAHEIGAEPQHVLPASTGVIGVELEPALITDAVPALVAGLSAKRFSDVASAIMTTDTRSKTAWREVESGSGIVRIAGMTKGAGMIHPNMATTLGFVITDAGIAPAALQTLLTDTVEQTYNRISVDGDMSTNDTVVLLANGASGVEVAASRLECFREALMSVMESLATQIVRDGEGARKRISIYVSGAADDDSAVRIARAIGNSPLVKTAIAGSDPNWGRILCAAGYSGAEFDSAAVDIQVQDVPVCVGGLAAAFSEADLKQKLDAAECTIRFAIHGQGKGEARFWTCDLTEKYIEINASYRT